MTAGIVNKGGVPPSTGFVGWEDGMGVFLGGFEGHPGHRYHISAKVQRSSSVLNEMKPTLVVSLDSDVSEDLESDIWFLQIFGYVAGVAALGALPAGYLIRGVNPQIKSKLP